MMTIRKCLGTLTMAAALLSAGACTGTIYDGPHHDYHKWDHHEDVVFQGYWSTQHKGDNRSFKQLNSGEQEEYWNWRHGHPN